MDIHSTLAEACRSGVTCIDVRIERKEGAVSTNGEAPHHPRLHRRRDGGRAARAEPHRAHPRRVAGARPPRDRRPATSPSPRASSPPRCV